MRFWTMLLNHNTSEIKSYQNELEYIFQDVNVINVKKSSNQSATLIQLDANLNKHTNNSIFTITPLSMPITYSGWLIDKTTKKLYSALKDNPIPYNILNSLILGEYSCATYDENGATFATDHYATHPIYYHNKKHKWIVSNDIRLVLICESVSHQIRQRACENFLSQDFMMDENELDNGMTFFLDIHKLEYNKIMYIESSGLKQKIIDGHFKIVSSEGFPKTKNSQEVLEIFRDTLNICVHDRLRAGASGLLLSGGIDSSTILGASLALAKHNPPFSISISFRDPDLAMSQDEHLLRALYEQLDLPHNILHVDDFLRLPSLTDYCSYIDGPDPAANPLAKEACAAFLLGQGISCAMTGEGGDIVLGESMHAWILDAIYDHEGPLALHRYLSHNLGVPFFSLRYWHMSLAATCPWLGKISLSRQFKRETTCVMPAFLTTQHAQPEANRKKNTFPFLGHTYMHRMLYPRAAYFDTLNVQCLHTHPYLDPRMLEFAFTCPPHFQHDFTNLEHTNPYRSAKLLARKAYQEELPEFIYSKQSKTSYALMARRMFQNSACNLYHLTERSMLLHERGLIDQDKFKRHLAAYIIATEDPNANLGSQYHYIRGVTDLETWIIRFSKPRDQMKEQLKIRPLRQFNP